MSQRVLIAEPYCILRAGLRLIFTEDSRVSVVAEVSSFEELQKKLMRERWDLVVINQMLIHDISMLNNTFVVLAAEPNMEVLLKVYRKGVRAYLLENVSTDLLLTTLQPTEGAFLVEPTLTSWLLEPSLASSFLAARTNKLTPREKEIMLLLRSGLDRTSIARNLHITDSTLKTHIKNITRKCSRKQDSFTGLIEQYR